MVIVRRLVGWLGFVAAVLGCAAIPVVLFAAVFSAASGDAFQRILALCPIVAIAGFFVTLLGWTDWSVAQIRRSPISWTCAALLAAALLWTAFGIDSTREVKSLPEAVLTYPSAIELGSSSKPAHGGWDSTSGATFSRSFTTTHRYSQVEAFYLGWLADAGWKGPTEYGYSGERNIDWRRDGFMLQLHFPSETDGTGRFSIMIYGPRAWPS
jgi:hypothetical protein